MKVYAQPLVLFRKKYSLLYETSSGSSGTVVGRRRFSFGLINYWNDSILQYMGSKITLLGILKICSRNFLHDLTQIPIPTLYSMIYTLEFTLDNHGESELQVRLAAIDPSSKIWVSNFAVLGGISPNKIDDENFYDFRRLAKSTEYRIWRTSNNLKLAVNQIPRSNFVKPREICNGLVSSKSDLNLRVIFRRNVEIFSGQSVVDKSIYYPSSPSETIASSSWPHVRPMNMSQKSYLPEPLRISSLERALFTGHSQSWFHFLIENLPRYLEFDPVIRSLPVVLPTGVYTQLKEVLCYLGFHNLYEVAPLESVYVADLFHSVDLRFSPRLNLLERRADILRISNALSTIQAVSANSSKFVFIRRPKTVFRQIANIEEIELYLLEEGFDIVEPEKLTFANQISVFSNAEVIVAESGAALTSLMFCRRGTKVIELQIYESIKEVFWEHFCDILSLNHNAVISQKRNTSLLKLLDLPIRYRVNDIHRNINGF